jgi:hypothetical protein
MMASDTRKRILVVDDTATVLIFTKMIHVGQAAEVVIARNGIEALKRVEEQTPAVILMDIMMPPFRGALRTRPCGALVGTLSISTRVGGRWTSADSFPNTVTVPNGRSCGFTSRELCGCRPVSELRSPGRGTRPARPIVGR